MSILKIKRKKLRTTTSTSSTAPDTTSDRSQLRLLVQILRMLQIQLLAIDLTHRLLLIILSEEYQHHPQLRLSAFEFHQQYSIIRSRIMGRIIHGTHVFHMFLFFLTLMQKKIKM